MTIENAKELIKLGAVYIGKNRIFEDKELKKDDHVRFYQMPRRYHVENVDWNKCIVKETAEYLIIDKPPGIPTIATTDNGFENVLEQMRRAHGPHLLITNRLDTPTSGLLVLAKEKTFQAKYNQWLVEGIVEKHYVAITEEKLPLGLMTHYMAPGDDLPKRVDKEPRKGWLKCSLEVKTCDVFEKQGIQYFRMTARLLTGRTHQIRVQFSHAGAPIVGDREYGFKGKAPIVGKREIALKAYKLEFPGESIELPNGT